MDARPEDIGRPEASDAYPTPLPAGFASPGGGELASLAGLTCRPLVALELGFHTRRLRTLQESVWDFRLSNIHGVDAGLDSIQRRLLALSDRLNVPQYALFTDLRNRIEERHDAAARFGGEIKGEVCKEATDPDTAMRAYASRVEERAVVLRAWQREDFEEVRLLSRKAVEGDQRLAAWWDIGFLMADIMLRPGTPESPATWTEGDMDGLLGAVAKLPSEEKAWVEDILPSTLPTEPRFPLLVNEAYKDLRAFIPEFEKRRAQHAPSKETDETVEEFSCSKDYRHWTWRGKSFHFSKTQALMMKALLEDWERGGRGLTAAELFEAAGSDRTEQRVDRVFQQTEKGRTGPHPAVVDGFILHENGLWWLNLKKARKRP
jgi:hypothetical protein